MHSSKSVTGPRSEAVDIGDSVRVNVGRRVTAIALIALLSGALAFGVADTFTHLVGAMVLAVCAYAAGALLVHPRWHIIAQEDGLVVRWGKQNRSRPILVPWTDVMALRIGQMPGMRVLGPVGARAPAPYLRIELRDLRVAVRGEASAYVRLAVGVRALAGSHVLADIYQSLANKPVDQLRRDMTTFSAHAETAAS